MKTFYSDFCNILYSSIRSHHPRYTTRIMIKFLIIPMAHMVEKCDTALWIACPAARETVLSQRDNFKTVLNFVK